MAVKSALYPAAEPFKTESLKVDDLHTLHLRQYGSPQGQPAVFLHGGPGGGVDWDTDPRRFDLSHYRVVAFDQRGSGGSTPTSSLENNTTHHLIADIEKIREHLQIDRWLVFGGSWGSTLSLAYAQAHPSRVTALVLRGIFLLRRSELTFFYHAGGTSFLFPDHFERYVSVIPEAERGDLIAAFHKRLTGDDKEERAKAAKAWTGWEMATSRLEVDPSYLAKAESDEFADVFSRIEAHYFQNGGFLRDGQLLEKAEIDKIRHIPAVIVQGRYDCVCPAKSAWDLHRAWSEADFHLVPSAGHSAKEPGIEKELVAATDRFRSLGARGP